MAGSQRLDRIERLIELFMKNQLAIKEQHDEAFKKLMTPRLPTQDNLEKLSAKPDPQGEAQARLFAHIDELVIAIGEIVRSNRETRRGIPPQ
jgi:hypothetical protein